MPEQPRVVIVIQPATPDGRRRIYTVDSRSGRQVDTGLAVHGQDNLDACVRHLKQQLEKAGNRVDVTTQTQ